MPNPPAFRPAWARLAAWLGFLAVFSALLAPVSVLAEDVRTGKLGGLCSVATASGALDAPGSDDASSTHTHCDMCGASGLSVPPARQATALSAAAATAMAGVFHDAVRSAAPPGLPFSRGPPVI